MRGASAQDAVALTERHESSTANNTPYRAAKGRAAATRLRLGNFRSAGGIRYRSISKTLPARVNDVSVMRSYALKGKEAIHIVIAALDYFPRSCSQRLQSASPTN